MLLRLGPNDPASPPRKSLEKQFILTNGESLQQGWPFLSKPVYHTEAYVLERRGEGTGSQTIYASLTKGDISNSEEPGCRRPAYPPRMLGAGERSTRRPRRLDTQRNDPARTSVQRGHIVSLGVTSRAFSLGRDQTFGHRCLWGETELRGIPQHGTGGCSRRHLELIRENRVGCGAFTVREVRN